MVNNSGVARGGLPWLTIEIFETTPADLVAVQPFEVVSKLPKVPVHASTVLK